MEHRAVEKEITEKAREWVDEYGEDFLIELIDVYLDEMPSRLVQLRKAFDDGDADALIREAHTLKSGSANVGATALSALAQQIEFAGRSGKLDCMAGDIERLQEEFAEVKATLQALRAAPDDFVTRDR